MEDIGGTDFWWRKQETGKDWAQFTTDGGRLEEGECERDGTEVGWLQVLRDWVLG